MNLKLKKQHLKTLSKDSKVLPMEQTPAVAGGKPQIKTNPRQCNANSEYWTCTGTACMTD